MRWRQSVLLTAALALICGAASSARADDDTRLFDPGDAVAGHPGMDYLDLLQLALPTLALNPDDHRVEAAPPNPQLRHLAGDQYEADPAYPFVLGHIEDKRIRIGGKPRIALLADFGKDHDRDQDYALLILMTDEPTPQVLDKADVGVDKDTFFALKPVLKVGPADDALITHSSHDDTITSPDSEDDTIDEFLLISTAGDHFALVNLVRLASEQVCGWRGVQTAAYATHPDPGHAYRRIDLAVRSVFTNPPGECGPGRIIKSDAHTYRASFRWNPASGRYVGATGELKRLEYFNERLFK